MSKFYKIIYTLQLSCANKKSYNVFRLIMICFIFFHISYLCYLSNYPLNQATASFQSSANNKKQIIMYYLYRISFSYVLPDLWQYKAQYAWLLLFGFYGKKLYL